MVLKVQLDYQEMLEIQVKKENQDQSDHLVVQVLVECPVLKEKMDQREKLGQKANKAVQVWMVSPEIRVYLEFPVRMEKGESKASKEPVVFKVKLE